MSGEHDQPGGGAAPTPPSGSGQPPAPAAAAAAAASHTDGHEKAHSHGGHHRHKGHAAHASAGPGAPLWMLSFADMMTNLLCFFILLSAFAQKQEGVLLEDGLGSIQRALLSIGLPGAMEGRTNPVQFNAGRVVYRSASSVNNKTLVEADGRILDSNRDTLRRVIVETLSQSGAATLPLPLLFEADTTELTIGHRAFLDEVGKYLASARFKIRIDGYAFEEGRGDLAEGWKISEGRARAARDHFVAAGIGASRITWVGHGPLEYGPGTKAGAAPIAQNQFGRRAVLVTFLE
jgi:flagellar motor protein MotB